MTEGSFIQGVFQIHLSTKADNIEHISKDDYATFIHEYVHYLQNILTPYGFLEILDKITRIHITLANAGSKESGTSLKCQNQKETTSDDAISNFFRDYAE